MSYNILAYSIYTLFVVFVIYKVGKICYTQGQIFVLHFIPKQLQLSMQINKLLLAGYYLVNIGYTIFMISTWDTINNSQGVIEQISSHAGQIIIILCILHYLNIILIQFYLTKQKQH